jgi:hypothetical protein
MTVSHLAHERTSCPTPEAWCFIDHQSTQPRDQCGHTVQIGVGSRVLALNIFPRLNFSALRGVWKFGIGEFGLGSGLGLVPALGTLHQPSTLVFLMLRRANNHNAFARWYCNGTRMGTYCTMKSHEATGGALALAPPPSFPTFRPSSPYSLRPISHHARPEHLPLAPNPLPSPVQFNDSPFPSFFSSWKREPTMLTAVFLRVKAHQF